ncbi:WD40/YVTN/BNR-like repeat-containing protein [Effusibacillus consociatus]
MSGGHSQSGELFHTEDGGMHWFEVSGYGTNRPNQLPFGGSNYFRDTVHGWTGRSSDQWGNYPDNLWLVKTRDGGKTWFHQNLPFPEDCKSNWKFIHAPQFFDTKNGVLPVTFSHPKNAFMLYITEDGGETWKQTKMLDNIGDGYAMAVTFKDRNHGWAFGGDRSKLYKTTDGGTSWAEITPNIYLTNTSQIQFVTDKIGFLLTNNNHLYKTIDGGENWVQI